MKYLASLFFAAAILTPAPPAFAGVVFETSFESPGVTSQTPKAAGADISKPSKPGEKPAWSRFEDQPNIGAEGGSVVAGLTNQIARTGTQSLFIEAAKLSVPFLGALFVSQPIAIEGGQYYKIGLWGRNDAKTPLVSAMAQLFLKIRVDFFSDEGKTEIGESQYMLQPLPGSKGHTPLLLTDTWNMIGMRFNAPPSAKFMVVSFRCDSSAERGAISGIAYFDDFTVSTDQRQPADLLMEKLLKEAGDDTEVEAPASATGEKDAKPSPSPANP